LNLDGKLDSKRWEYGKEIIINMTFNCIGIKPKNKKGERFDSNNWWWRSLWDYVCIRSNDVIDENLRKGGHFNDGMEVSEQLCSLISKRIRGSLENGDVKRCEEENKRLYERLPEQFCYFCNGSGEKEKGIICEACSGKGITKIGFFYPFDEDFVKKFLEFVENSGGFEIW